MSNHTQAEFDAMTETWDNIPDAPLYRVFIDLEGRPAQTVADARAALTAIGYHDARLLATTSPALGMWHLELRVEDEASFEIDGGWLRVWSGRGSMHVDGRA